MFSDPIFVNNLVIPIAGMLTGVILGFPVIKAVIRYVEHKSGVASGADRMAPELHEMRDRLEALEDRVEQRLVEVEERLDFTERVLAQNRDRSALPGGDS